MVFFIPFEIDLGRFRLELPFINTSLEIITAVTFVFFFVKKIRERKFVRSPFDGYILAFLLFCLFSALFVAADPYWSLKFTLRLMGGIFFYYLVLDSVRDLKNVRDTVSVLLLSGFIVAVIGFGEKYFLEKMRWLLEIFSYYRSYLQGVRGELLRVSSTFMYTNVLAMYLEMVIPVAASIFIYQLTKSPVPEKWRGRFYFFALLLLIETLIFTYSRAGLIVLFGALLYIFILHYLSRNTADDPAGGKGRLKGYQGAAAVAMIAAILYGVTAYWDFTLQSRLSRMADTSYQPNAQRLYVWDCALKAIRQHPVLGIGPDSFRWLYASKYALSSPYIKYNPNTPIPGVDSNNIYLEIFVSFGAVGFCVYFLMLFRHFAYFLKNLLLYENSYLLYVSIGAGGSLAAYFIHGFVDSFSGYQAIVFLFWFFLGLIVVLPKVGKKL